MTVPFEPLVWAHIATGATGLVSLWPAVFARKGSTLHRNAGKLFAYMMIATGALAIGISLCSLYAPVETHPWSVDPERAMDVPTLRGLFGWMMLYLGVLTIALCWHGLMSAWNKRDYAANRTARNVALQGLMIIAGLWCAARGMSLGQPIMIGVAIPGIVAGGLNTLFLLDRAPAMNEWLVQHFRGQIGAAISVYTAFFAFGAVNMFPALAFNPVLWSLPTVLGVSYMIWHQLKVFHQRRRAGQRSAWVAEVTYDLLTGTRPIAALHRTDMAPNKRRPVSPAE